MPPAHQIPVRPSRRNRGNHGSMLVIVVLVICVLSGIAGVILALLPGYARTSFQDASWQEAMGGAEAGVDLAMMAVQASVPDPTANPWTNWTAPGGGGTNGPWTLQTSSTPSLTHAGEGNTNLAIDSVQVEVFTRDPNTDSDPAGTPWYRIRAVGRADVPGSTVAAPDMRDAELRRMNLAGGAKPQVKRAVEVIAQPIYLWTNAIVSKGSYSGGNSANWGVDSFNSAVGTYGGSNVGNNGNVATTNATINLASGKIYGNVSTNGGDDLSTYWHSPTSGGGQLTTGYWENITGGSYLSGGPTAANPSGLSNLTGVVASDYTLAVDPVMPPAWTLPGSPVTIQANPTIGGKSGTTFVAGTAATHARYIVNQSVGGFSVAAPSGLATGAMAYVDIYINGSITGAPINIPPNVTAKIWVNGDVDFGSGNSGINTGSGNSNKPAQLMVYGVKGVTIDSTTGLPAYTGSTTSRPILSAGGTQDASMTFYGPQYNANFHGTVNYYGAVVTNDFSINGGGNGGFHYDVALGRTGPVAYYKVASYVEDARRVP